MGADPISLAIISAATASAVKGGIDYLGQNNALQEGKIAQSEAEDLQFTQDAEQKNLYDIQNKEMLRMTGANETDALSMSSLSQGLGLDEGTDMNELIKMLFGGSKGGLQ